MCPCFLLAKIAVRLSFTTRERGKSTRPSATLKDGLAAFSKISISYHLCMTLNASFLSKLKLFPCQKHGPCLLIKPRDFYKGNDEFNG